MSPCDHNRRTTRPRGGSPSWWGVGLAMCGLALAPERHALADQYTPGEIQIELSAGVPIGSINDRYGTATADSLPPLYLLRLEPGADEYQMLLDMQLDQEIVHAELSWDNESPEATRGMAVIAVGGTVEGFLDQDVAVRLSLAAAHMHTQGDGVLIAAIDTGVLAGHPALAGVVAPGGFDFVDDDMDPSDTANGIDDDGDDETDEGAGHGTMIAGIAHLVAPNARILPIRVLNDDGFGKTFDLAKGIRYAVDHGAQVINLSLGLSSSCWVIGHEVDRAYQQGVVMVGAAGNDGIENALFPARDSDVLCVTGLDSLDVKADFSNWDSTVDLSGPGVGILAPYHDGEYAIGAGTSFAAPFVAGQVALVLSTNPALSTAEVYDVARLGVDSIYGIPGNEEYLGKLGTGRLDAYKTWYSTPKAAEAPDGWVAGTRRLAIGPNPCRSGEMVTIAASATREIIPRLSVFDPAGRRIRSLAAGADGRFRWDGRDGSGRAVRPGTYFVAADRGSRGRGGAARVVVLDP